MTVQILTTVIHNTLQIAVYVFFYLIEQHSKFLLHNLQVLYMCTVCDQHYNPARSACRRWRFQWRFRSVPSVPDTHAPCLLKLCIPPSSGIVRWRVFPEFGAELPLDRCTPTIILNNPVYNEWVTDGQQQHTLYNFPFRIGQHRHVKGNSLLSRKTIQITFTSLKVRQYLCLYRNDFVETPRRSLIHGCLCFGNANSPRLQDNGRYIGLFKMIVSGS